MLNDLLTLARNPSREARGHLLQRVADVFLDGVGKHTEAELVLFCEIILKLLEGSSLTQRARLSRRMAPWGETPNRVAYRLASDEITVAAPMLEQSPSLTESDLLKLTRRMPQTHLIAIAHRVDMPRRVSDLLVEKGTIRVWRTMAGNTRSSMSDWAMRTLAKRSISDTQLRRNLSARHDLTPLICDWLIPHVNTPTRIRLEAIRSGSNPGQMTTPEEIRKELRSRFDISIETCDVERLWQLVRSEDFSLDKLMLVLLAERRHNDALDLFARRMKRALHAMQGTVFQAGIDELISQAHAAGLSDQVFLALAQLRCQHLRIPESQATRWLDMFRQLAPASRNSGAPPAKSPPSSRAPN